MRAAHDIASAVRRGELRAGEVVAQALAAIRERDGAINAFTETFELRALQEAAVVDATIASGHDPGPLAGVPFAVKNLFDVAGKVTLAGSRIERESAPAARNATAIERLTGAGAVLVGALNMDEYAYGFTTENTHYGPTRNPHDATRTAGGSSGGSAAAVAAGMVPLTLGSDTNGSIRVPASLCGVWGLKPTYGRVSRAGTYPFVHSLDHVGPFAAYVRDLALSYDAMAGYDARDPVCADRPANATEPLLTQGVSDLRLAVADEYFARPLADEARKAIALVADALHVHRRVTVPEAQRARAAAFVITASEGGTLHLADLRVRAEDFEPLSRDRLLAGALVPAAWVHHAQRFRRWYHDRVLEIFRDVDAILAPATPCAATPIGAETMTLDGETMPVRPNLGLFTQPISFIGLPVVAAPIAIENALPIGIQIIAAPWREDVCLRIAAELERRNVARARIA